MYQCHKCGAAWESAKRQPGFKEYCDQCNAYLHCCKNCRFYLRSAPNQCYIPNTETIADKGAANFCEEFAFKEAGAEGPGSREQDAARAKLEELLGPAKKSSLPGDFLESETRKPKSLDDLFGD